MINFTAKYAKVYNPHIDLSVSEKIVFATLKTSRVDKRTDPVSYHHSEWPNVAFVGSAFEAAKAFTGGEVIDVQRGSATMETAPSGTDLKFTVFDFLPSPLKKSDD